MKLRKYLEENGMKQNFFAKKAGISLMTLVKILNEPSDILLSVALKIEDATNGEVTCKDLIKSTSKSPKNLKELVRRKSSTKNHVK